MRAVGAYEAKTHLSRLIEDVAHGERVAITKNGVPVATLVPVPASRKADPRDVVRQIKELRRQARLEGLSLRDLIEEGRRS